MSMSSDTTQAGGALPPARAFEDQEAGVPMVPVWDRFVRVVHWSLVGLFVIAFVTGDEVEWLHLAAGYTIAGLVALRIVWGFVGPTHARFADFVRGPAAVGDYLRQAAQLKAPRYLGHNPAGGAMVVVLLTMLIAISATGFMMTTDAFWGEEWLEDVHEGLVNVTLVLIALHVAGVLVTGMVHGENLVKAMFTGRKRAS